jgi:hypothetical protein
MRCNSSCGHGRHANFWSRVSYSSNDWSLPAFAL